MSRVRVLFCAVSVAILSLAGINAAHANHACAQVYQVVLHGTNGADYWDKSQPGAAVHGYCVDGMGGNDSFIANQDYYFTDWFYGRNGDDSADLERGTDKAWGGPGEDWIFTGESDDYLEGGDGADYLSAGSATESDVIWAGAGADYINAGGVGDHDYIYDGYGDDVIVGDAGDTWMVCPDAYIDEDNPGSDFKGEKVLNGDAGCDGPS